MSSSRLLLAVTAATLMSAGCFVGVEVEEEDGDRVLVWLK